MYALAINGSPRTGGNTDLALRKTMQPLIDSGWETEIVHIGKEKIRGCIACFGCFKSKDKQCAVKDDIFNDIMAKIVKADAILIGSPTYFADVTTNIKAVMDRAGFVAIANGRILKGKVGAAVVTVRRGGGVHVFDTINHLFLMSQMVVPGSVYWNLGYGLNKGEVEKDAEGMDSYRVLGETIDVVTKALVPVRDKWPTGGSY